MTNNERSARAAGYHLRRGRYQGTIDDRADLWYVVHETDTEFHPTRGFATTDEAWDEAVRNERELRHAFGEN